MFTSLCPVGQTVIAVGGLSSAFSVQTYSGNSIVGKAVVEADGILHTTAEPSANRREQDNTLEERPIQEYRGTANSKRH
jgi:hypothetical protein